MFQQLKENNQALSLGMSGTVSVFCLFPLSYSHISATLIAFQSLKASVFGSRHHEPPFQIRCDKQEGTLTMALHAYWLMSTNEHALDNPPFRNLE